MAVTKKQHISIGLLWILIVPISFYIAYHYFPNTDIHISNVIILMMIVFLIMLVPITLDNVSISLERFITFAVFLQYGAFAEMLFSQIAMLILLFTERSSFPLSFKFFVNSTLFALVSMISAFVFHVTGGVIDSQNFAYLFVFAFIYATANTGSNNLLLHFYLKTLNIQHSLFSKAAKWDYIATLSVIPFSVSLYFLHLYLGNYSVLLVGIPFVLLMLGIRLYNDSDDMQSQLEIASEIGHQLANKLEFDEVLKVFLQQLHKITSYDSGYIVDLRSGKSLIPLMANEDEHLTKKPQYIAFLTEKREGDGIDSSHPMILSTRRELMQLTTIKFDDAIQSVLICPIVRAGKTEAFLFLTSNRKYAFKESIIQIVEILSNYLSVSAERAKFYESQIEKSERCGLTKLYNYRYLDNTLDALVKKHHQGEIDSVSTIILDIDHFKSINDTYGHENGNIILIELAKILSSFINESGIVARYGGEEFVFLLCNKTREETAQFAENVRSAVEKSRFSIYEDLKQERNLIDVHITISLGVAMIPTDASTAKTLLRNADRALYIGGKQAGRNKVGFFGIEGSRIATLTEEQELKL